MPSWFPDDGKQPAPAKIAVAVLPNSLKSNVGAGQMTEGRVEEAGHSGEADLSGLLVRRDIVN